MNRLIPLLSKKISLKIGLCAVFLGLLGISPAFAETQEIRTRASETSEGWGLGNRVYLNQTIPNLDLAYGEKFYVKLFISWLNADHRDLIVGLLTSEDGLGWRPLYDGYNSTYTWEEEGPIGFLFIEVEENFWDNIDPNQKYYGLHLDFRGVSGQFSYGSINDTFPGGYAFWRDNFGSGVPRPDTEIKDLYFYIGNTPLSDFPTFPEGEEIILPDIECDTGDFLADALCKVNVLLFKPSGEVLALFGNLLEPIKQKVPFGYFSLLKNEFEGMEEGDPVFSLGVDDISFFSNIRGCLVFIIWLFAGATIFKRIIKLEL